MSQNFGSQPKKAYGWTMDFRRVSLLRIRIVREEDTIARVERKTKQRKRLRSE